MPENDDKDDGQSEQTAITEKINQLSSAFEVIPVRLPKSLRWILVAGGVLLLALLLVSIFHPSMSERVKFFTVNALSLLVLVAIVVQAFIYRRQWAVMEEQRSAMKGQLDVMKDQTTAIRTQAEASQSSARAAETSAKAAKETSEVALKSFVIAERPEIYFKKTLMHNLEIGKPTEIVLSACNGGRITAYRVVIEANFCCAPRALFSGVLPYTDTSIDRSIDIMPPAADVTFRALLPFVPAEPQINGLKTGVLSLFIYGRIRYEDGHGRKYQQTYYRQYNPSDPTDLTYAPDFVRTEDDKKARQNSTD